MTHGREFLWPARRHSSTLGGHHYARINVQNSCIDIDACIDTAVLVFLAVVLFVVAVLLIGPARILKWFCCCHFCARSKPQVTEEGEAREEGDGARTCTQQPPRYEEAVNMLTVTAAAALDDSRTRKDECELPPPDYGTVRWTSTCQRIENEQERQ